MLEPEVFDYNHPASSSKSEWRMDMRKLHPHLMIVLVSLMVSACATYYKVTDPASGKNFYTTKVDRALSGAVTFKDAVSGSEVTLQSSEVLKIPSKEFEQATGGK